MRHAILLLLPVFVIGCTTADMMRRPDEPGLAYAPENELGSGEIKYLNAGADFVKQERRADAYRQMHEACNGPYRIDAESDSADVSVASAMFAPGAQMVYRHIRFSCSTKAPAPSPRQAPPTAADVARAAEDEAARGAAFGRSKFTGAKEVVDAEDKLRVRAGKELVCEPADLRVSPVEVADVPAGWSAKVIGCDKTAVYVFGRDGWTKQP
jgi:hypothetical protein